MLSADPDRRARFEREAHAVAALSDPHISLHDIGTEGGTTYLMTEHLMGETLAERLAKGPSRSRTSSTLVPRLRWAFPPHTKAGIVHRDLKPANVMLVRGAMASGPPTVKLLDVGLAKLTGHAEARHASNDSSYACLI